METTRLIIVAVGGQGNLLASKVLGEAALISDVPVRMSEIHGMAQRGGAVQSHLRLSKGRIHSDLIPDGKVDLVLAVEPLESLRYAHALDPEAAPLPAHDRLVISERPQRFRGQVVIEAETVHLSWSQVLGSNLRHHGLQILARQASRSRGSLDHVAADRTAEDQQRDGAANASCNPFTLSTELHHIMKPDALR